MLEAISSELPLHMRRYSLYRGRLLGIDLVFATVNQDEQSASEYAQMALLFRRELSLPVVFVFQSLPSAKRNSLIRHGVPFVVPKWQLFLPPNLHLNERAPQTGVVRKSMRPATQAVVIRQLVRGDVEGRTAGEIAKTLGFSKMTLSNVSSELATLAGRGLSASRLVGGHYGTWRILIWLRPSSVLCLMRSIRQISLWRD